MYSMFNEQRQVLRIVKSFSNPRSGPEDHFRRDLVSNFFHSWSVLLRLILKLLVLLQKWQIRVLTTGSTQKRPDGKQYCKISFYCEREGKCDRWSGHLTGTAFWSRTELLTADLDEFNLFLLFLLQIFEGDRPGFWGWRAVSWSPRSSK